MVGWLVGETVLYSILSRFPEEGGGKAMGDGEREVEKRGMIAGKNKYPNNTTRTCYKHSRSLPHYYQNYRDAPVLKFIQHRHLTTYVVGMGVSVL